MADWTDLPDTAVGIGGLPSGTTVTALRDNAIAIAEGAAGAPKIQEAALTDITAAWVAGRTAGIAAGAIGSYAFLGRTNLAGGSRLFGETLAGSNLFPAGIIASGNFNTDTPSSISNHGGQDSARAGTWRCMGVMRTSGSTSGATLWLRIS